MLTGDEFASVRTEVMTMVENIYSGRGGGKRFSEYAVSQGWITSAADAHDTFADAYGDVGWRQALRQWAGQAYLSEHIVFLEADDRYQQGPSADAANAIYDAHVDSSAEQFVNVSAVKVRQVRAAIDAAAPGGDEWANVPARGRSGGMDDTDYPPPPPPEGFEGVYDPAAPPLPVHVGDVPPPPPEGFEGIYDPHALVPPPPPEGFEGVFDPDEIPPPPPV